MQHKVSHDLEQRREHGSTLVLLGWLFWIFAALTLFFRSSVPHAGDSMLNSFAGLLVGAGLVLYVLGRIVRHRAK